MGSREAGRQAGIPTGSVVYIPGARGDPRGLGFSNLSEI